MEPKPLIGQVYSEDLTAVVRQQKRQLAILSTIIQTVSNSANIKETLETALEIVLSEINSDTGWICLLDEDGSCSAFVGYQGLCFENEDSDPPHCLVNCVCSRVRTTKDAVVVRKLSHGCPLVEVEGENGEKIIGHVSIPLVTKSRIVGQLNVAFNEANQADRMDISLLKSISPQLAVAVENARLWEDLQTKETLRKELLKKVVTAQEEERRRISRELHDEFGQELTSLLVRLQLLQNLCTISKGEELINSVEGSVAKMLTSIHDLSLELRPTALDDLGLVPALGQYIKGCPDYLGVQVDFETVGDFSQRLPREVETTLYRIVQESLTNVARHSNICKASVLLKRNEKAVVAIIEDYGVGFDLKDVKTGQAKKNRLGLYGMEERAALVGGKLTIETAPEEGTTIYIEIPLGD